MSTSKIFVSTSFIIELHNKVSTGKYTKGLGQLQLSFAYPFEDVNSIALTGISQDMQSSTIFFKNTTSAPPESAGLKSAQKHSSTSPSPPRPCLCRSSRDTTTSKVALKIFRSHQRQCLLRSHQCSYQHPQLDVLALLGRSLRHRGGS
jgi:hypothetical protein